MTAPPLPPADSAVGIGLRAAASKAEFQAERAALQALGVDLDETHLDGYAYKPDRFEDDEREQAKPWEVSLHEQMEQLLGPSQAMLSESIESWKNDEFLFEIREGIAYCTMNRPAANNAMNDGINSGLHDAIRILKRRPDIRIAVLTGNGRMFCAGGDPKSFQAAQASAGVISQDESGGDGGAGAAAPAVAPALNPAIITGAAGYVESQFSRRGKEAMAATLAREFFEWATLPQFTIALVNGSAMGGGVGLLCCCDMAVAVKTAHVTLSEVKLGVIPAVISPHVIRTIGAANAKKLFVTAETCSMQQAKAYGMIQRIVDDVSAFPAVVKEVAAKVRGCAPGALSATKRCALNCLNQPMSAGLMAYTADEYLRARRSEECEAGMKALATRTRPRWVESAIDVRDA